MIDILKPSVWIFIVFALLSVIPAFVVAFSKNIVHSVISLFLSLTGVAVLYGYLGADFVAVVQILIYVGGVVVLYLFGIMMTREIKLDVNLSNAPIGLGWGILFGAVFFVLVWGAISQVKWPIARISGTPTTSPIGNAFLSTYLLPFEIVTVLLTVVLIGAVIIARKEIKK